MSCLVNNRLSSIFSQMIELGCLFYLVNFFILFIYLKINVGKWAIGNAISIVTLTISLCPLPRWSEIFEGNPSVSSTLLTWNAENKKEKLLYCPMMLQVLKQTVVWFYAFQVTSHEDKRKTVKTLVNFTPSCLGYWEEAGKLSGRNLHWRTWSWGAKRSDEATTPSNRETGWQEFKTKMKRQTKIQPERKQLKSPTLIT